LTIVADIVDVDGDPLADSKVFEKIVFVIGCMVYKQLTAGF